jgi:YD repeat-containing protein
MATGTAPVLRPSILGGGLTVHDNDCSLRFRRSFTSGPSTIPWRLAVICLAIAVFSSLPAKAAGAQVGTRPASDSSSPLKASLTVPSVETLNGDQEAIAVAEAERANPTAAAAREASRTENEGQSQAQASQTDDEAFSSYLSHQEGGPPPLPTGQSIIGYSTPQVAQLSLPGGQDGVIDSAIPMAVERAPDKYAPLNLSLRESGGSFVSATPLVPVDLPKRLASGAQLPDEGLSLTPVRADGSPLEGAEGAVDGATELFTNTETDTDTLLKPTTRGVDAGTILRSIESPERLYYRIGMPQGAALRAGAQGSDSIEVVKEGTTIAILAPPKAVDSAGAAVPTAMTAEGNVVELTVQHRSGSYHYPILVDPEFWVVWANGEEAGKWEFHEFEGYTYGNTGQELWMKHTGYYPEGDYASWIAQTKGYTSIYDMYVKDDMYPTYSGSETGYKESTFPFQRGWIEIYKSGSEEEFTNLAGVPYSTEATVCARSNCQPEGVAHENWEVFSLSTAQSGSEPFGGSVSLVAAAIGEEKGKHSTTSYNTSTGILYVNGTEPQRNVLLPLYPFWIGQGEGAFEFTARDEGLGVAETFVEYKAATGWERVADFDYQDTGHCVGVQCATSESQVLDYNGLLGAGGKKLPTGEDRIRVAARSAEPYTTSTEYGEGETTLKVDDTPPEDLKVTGMPVTKVGDEEEIQLSEAEAHLKVEATDANSGIRSLALYVDEREIGSAGGYCSGTCTGSDEWSVNGAELGVGTHTLEVQAIDNANNKETKYYKLTVYHASPVQLGPGSVNPESGDYALEATDAQLSGGTGTLSVSRHYDSRNTARNKEGPLGPQWTINLNSQSELEELPSGSMVSVGAEGLTLFTKSGSSFEAPEGDRNLTLEYKPTYEEKGPAYLLSDPKQGTTTVFRLPAGATVWLPSASKGPISTDTVTDEYETIEVEGKPVVRPTLEIAPHPELTCEKSNMQQGCRALELIYQGSEKTAKGEGRSEWGAYPHRLKEIIAIAYSPAGKKVERTPVVAYEYDAQGRLRAEQNPEVGLKTVYGYDSEGHVTAVTPPGQQPWLFRYGTAEGDTNLGRLLSTIRASTVEGDGKAPQNTFAPTVSSSELQVGKAVTVSNGSWANSPLSYGYQWYEVARRVGEDGYIYECLPISGAVDPTYTPLSSSRGKQIYAEVTAYNSSGATRASSSEGSCSARGTVVGGSGELNVEPTPPAPEKGANAESTVEYDVPVTGSGAPFELSSEAVKAWDQTDDPKQAAAILPPQHPERWPAEKYIGASVYYMDSRALTVNVASPSGGIGTTEYNTGGDPIRTLSAANRIEALKAPEPKLAAVALDTESVYSGENDLTETLGPEHLVKLNDGKEVEARNHVQYGYDEEAPAGDEHLGLVTKTTDGAKYEGKESDVRTVTDSYSGQDDLGWELRKPTETVTEPHGIDLVHKTIYDKVTGNVIEARKPEGSSETVYPPAYTNFFGSKGSGEGQFEQPQGSAVDPHGDIWVVDQGNDRIERRYASGGLIAQYGSEGSGNLQFRHPWGIAINSETGDVYVADKGNNRIEELSLSGSYIASFGTSGSGALSEPTDVAIDSSGNVWVSDYGHNRLVEYSSEGTFLQEVGKGGSGNGQFRGPGGIAVSEGSVFVIDVRNSRVEQFSTSGEYLGQFGSEGSGSGQLKEPAGGIAVNPSTGDLYIADTYNYRIEEFSPSGRFLTEWDTWGPTHECSSPTGLSIDSSGKLYVSDAVCDRVTIWAPPETEVAKLTYATQFGSSGSGNGQFSSPIASAVDGEGNVWVSDYGNNRIEEFSSGGSFIASYGSPGSGEGQFNGPGGIDINQSTGKVYVADTNNHRIEEFTKAGKFVKAFGTSGSGALSRPGGVKVDAEGHVWVADEAQDRIVEFSSSGSFIAAYGSEGSHEGQFNDPTALAFSGVHVYVSDAGNHRIEEFSTATGRYISQFGEEGDGSGELYSPQAIATDAAGNLYVVDNGAGHVEEFSAAGGFRATFGSPGSGNGELQGPVGDAIDAAGNMYVVDTGNNRIEKWTTQAVHDIQTIYYGSEANGEYPGCGKHPEWLDLICQTQPGAQPNTSGLPNLPVTKYTYNMWDQAEKITEEFGPTTRTRTTTFDSAGRPLTAEEKATTKEEKTPANEALPKVTDVYNKENGTVEQQSTKVGKKTETVTSLYNKLGKLEQYTDADGNTATYRYEPYGELASVLDGSEAGEGKQSYHYDGTTGELAELTDSAAHTFSATYEVDGDIATESYPDGLTAYYTYNSVGEATGIEYKKLTHCTKKCTWFSDDIVPSIHGETAKQTSTLSEEPEYTYNELGHAIQVQEIPAGQACTTRDYTYDEESNRTSLLTHPPGSGGKCTNEGGTIESHTYDGANRLTDTGVTYDAFGDITKLPAADSGGPGGGSELISTYYVDGQVYKQSQEGKNIEYLFDPEERPRETITSGSVNNVAISHYDGPGMAAAWQTETEGKWTRDIPGIDGELAAIKSSSGEPILLLHDLKGNVIAEAAFSETETKLLATYNSSEFGVPTTNSAPPKYAWLGASGMTSELSSGAITQDGATYVPLTGKMLQTEQTELPVPSMTATPFTDEHSSEGYEIGPKGAAREQSEFEEEQRRREEAEHPAGACNVELECGGSWEDPKGILWWKATEERANMIAHWAGEIEEAAEALHSDISDGASGLVWSDAEYEHAYAMRLGKCAQLAKGYEPKGVCYLAYEDETLDVIGVGYFHLVKLGSGVAEACVWESGHVENHETFYCPNRGHFVG